MKSSKNCGKRDHMIRQLKLSPQNWDNADDNTECHYAASLMRCQQGKTCANNNSKSCYGDVDGKQAMYITNLEHLGQGSSAFVTNVVGTQVESMYPGIP